MVTPEGATIDVASDVTGWTPSQVYGLLSQSARDLARVGPTLEIKVQTAYPSQAATSYGDSFRAIIYLQATTNSNFTAHPEASVAHEYGHVWTLYWYYTAHSASWNAYLVARGLFGDPRLDSSYSWSVREIAADDYRLLFGSSAAVSQMAHLNQDIPDPRNVAGLRSFLLNNWAG